MDGTWMKRTILALVVAVAAAGAGAGAAILSTHGRNAGATSQQRGPARHTTPTQVLVFISKDSKVGYVDRKPSGLSAGDVLTQHSTWYQHGQSVGVMALTGTATLRRTAQTGEVMFTAVASLENGDVVMTGRFDVVPRNQTFQAAITGGTGLYANAGGYAVFDQVSSDVTKVTLDLTT